MRRPTSLEEVEIKMESVGSKSSFAMTGGSGTYSYARNSTRQKGAAEAVKDRLVKAIVDNIDIKSGVPAPTQYRISDFGCSIGPNTFIAVNNIIEAVTQKYRLTDGKSSPLPEFHVFFNDHYSNDFNALFANLPPERPYFAAGVPGSFHTRLFPRGHLDFAYSSFSLQWLSTSPPELSDPTSPACNRGRIYYSDAPKEVGEAYAAQYAKDMSSFLEARAQELAREALMALLLPARPDATLPAQFSLGPFFQPLESTLIDMVNEGVINKAKLDSFNIPIYCPSQKELQNLIDRDGCFSTIEMVLFPEEAPPLITPRECRAGFEKLLEKQFGSHPIDEIFERYGKKVAGRPPMTPAYGIPPTLLALLKRN